MNSIQGNIKITAEDIINNPQFDWCSFSLSCNPSITFDTIIATEHIINWNYSFISSHNRTITMDIIKNNPDKHWDYAWIGSHMNITLDMILSNLDKPWNFSWIARHPNLTFADIKKIPGVDWTKQKSLSWNPNLTFDDIINNPEYQWCFGMLSSNKFNKNPIVYNRLICNHIIDTFPVKDIGKLIASYYHI